MHKELEQPFNYGQQWEELRQVEDEKEHHLSYQPYIPLPRRRTPWPWEDLASLVSRTAEAMGYLSPDWILHPQSIRYKIAAKDLLFPTGQDCHPMLDRLLGLNEATLRTLTIHRFTIGQIETPASEQRLLGKLGVDASACGEPLINDELTLLQNLTSPQYLWITTKFLTLFEDYLYRRELLPFLKWHALKYDLSSQLDSRYNNLQWWETRDKATSDLEKLLAEGDCW